METAALESRDFLDSHPDHAEVAIAHIVKESATAFYIVKTGTPDGREWAVSKVYISPASYFLYLYISLLII